jgi:TonB-dependent siderophore receptor
MKSSFTLLFLLFFGLFVQAQNPTGTIRGTILTTDGQPATSVNVVIKGSNLGARADESGRFTIKNVPAGAQVLVVSMVGHQPEEKAIEVQAGDNLIENIVLAETSEQLQEVVVVGEAVNKFAQKETDYVSRMPLKNLENPQVYTVVDKDLMKEQIVLERTDIYLNVPGAVPNFLAGGSQGMSMRGFATTVGMRNGMVTSAIVPLNPVILERLEVVKGPAGTLFGGNRSATFGGIYNYITKKPYDHFGGEVSYTTGSFDLSRITADVNAPLNKDKTALFRVNAGWQSEGSFQDQGFSKNYTFAPSFSYQVNPRLKFMVDADLTRSTFTISTFSIASMSKVSARSFKDLPLDYKHSYINNSLDITNGINNVQARIEYKISDQWTSQTNYLYSEGFYKSFLWTTLNMLTDSTMSRTVRNQKPETFGNIQFQQNFIGDFFIGSFRNRMLVGLDYNNNYNKLNRVTLTYDTVNLNQPLKIMNADKIDDLAYQRGFAASTTKTESYGLYASDVFNITRKLLVMLSLRMDRFTTDGTYTVSTGLYTGGYSQTSWSPKLGFVYQPVEGKVTVFGNYTNGFINLAPVLQPDNTLLKLKPQYGNQWETGIKLDILKNRLNATVSYYDITVTNSTRTELVEGKTFMFQDGSQKSRGAELELIASPVTGLNIVAGYAYNENEYSKASPALEGKSLAASPKQVANIWASYRITQGQIKGLGFGVGGNYVSDSWFEATNTFAIPSYTLVNATIFYSQPRYTFALKGNNLLNEEYWNSNGTPQKPINLVANVTFRF